MKITRLTKMNVCFCSVIFMVLLLIPAPNKVADSQIIFTNDLVGTVSDHFGVLTKVIIVN